MFKKIIHKLALKCEDATLLMEMKNSNKISSSQDLLLKTHLAICKYCRNYQKKALVIDRLLLQQKNSEEKIVIDKERLERLKEKISKKIV